MSDLISPGVPTSGTERRPAALRFVLWTLVLLAFGVLGAVLWQAWADPSRYVVTERGAVLGEEAVRGQFQVVAVFVAVGAALSFVGAAAAAVALRDRGWLLVPWLVATTTVSAVIAWRLGVWWGPEEPTASSVKGLSLGDTVPSALKVDTWTAFLAWPVAALVALMVVTYVIGLRSVARERA